MLTRDLRETKETGQRPHAVLTMVFCVCLVIHASLLAVSSSLHCPVMDEVAHLPSGVYHWRTGFFNLYRVNPPLVRMLAALPVLAVGSDEDWGNIDDNGQLWMRPEFVVGFEYADANRSRLIQLMTFARWTIVPVSVIGAVVCWKWAGALFGWPAALVAATLWCFSPTVLAYGSLIVPDVAAASFGVFSAFCFWRWMRQPTWQAAIIGGGVTGTALLTKTTWLFLLPLWPLYWAVAVIIARRNKLHGNRGVEEKWQLLVIVLLSLIILNSGYGWHGSFQRLGAYEFTSYALSGKNYAETGQRETGNVFRGGILSNFPVPLPLDYVMGVDLQKRDFELPRRSYLRGYWRTGGWWYYYLYAVCVKVPLACLILGVMALALRLVDTRVGASTKSELMLITPIVIIVVMVSSQSNMNRYLRYLLPAFPFAFIWISSVLQHVNYRRVIAVGCLLLWFIASSLRVYPHSMSYFNELAGGPENGHFHLVDANIDWGQDLLFLRRWLDHHPEARPFYLAYYGTLDPEKFGVTYGLPPFGPEVEIGPTYYDPNSTGPLPGWYAISVNFLRGHRDPVPTGDGQRIKVEDSYFAYFLHFRPVAMAGYSIYIYHLTLSDVNPVRRELGLPELTADAANEYTRYSVESK